MNELLVLPRQSGKTINKYVDKLLKRHRAALAAVREVYKEYLIDDSNRIFSDDWIKSLQDNSKNHESEHIVPDSEVINFSDYLQELALKSCQVPKEYLGIDTGGLPGYSIKILDDRLFIGSD